MAPRGTARHIGIKETSASRAGIKYVAANGTSIVNEGERRISGVTDDGIRLDMTWQVADVKKPLASIGRMCDAGNVAVFTDQGGYIVSKEDFSEELKALHRKPGDKLKMKRDKGVYSFSVWVEKPKEHAKLENRFAALSCEQDEELEESSVFTGPGVDWM